MNIADIVIGDRHRKDLGDIDALAASIKEQGLLSPIGITPENQLVFGFRRLMAVRDILGWYAVDTRTVNVTSIAEGEFAENEIRKQFTTSERISILEVVEAQLTERERRGGDRRSKEDQSGKKTTLLQSGKTRDLAAKRAGFGGEGTVRKAKAVVETNDPVLIDAMDTGLASINAAAELAKLPVAQRYAIIAEAKSSGKKAKPPKSEVVKKAPAQRGRPATTGTKTEDLVARRAARDEARAKREAEGERLVWDGRPVIMYGVQMWPLDDAGRLSLGHYDYDQLFFAIHQFKSWMGLLAPTEDYASRGILMRERIKPLWLFSERRLAEPCRTEMKRFIGVYQKLADLYKANPAGECRPPFDAVLQRAS
jgi:ParB-like chromosome segregation protein Spo0J